MLINSIKWFIYHFGALILFRNCQQQSITMWSHMPSEYVQDNSEVVQSVVLRPAAGCLPLKLMEEKKKIALLLGTESGE